MESYERNRNLRPGQIDMIEIHFTDPFSLGSSTFGYQEHVFHSFTLKLGIHTTGQYHLKQVVYCVLEYLLTETWVTAPELKDIIPNTPASPQVATPDVFQAIGHWIDDCLENHTECPRSTNTPLPTRVLDVGKDAQVPSEHVRLHVSSAGECGRYVALSYCWGTGTQTRTLQQNLGEHMRSITVSSLPQTMQDAIRVTRELKVRYLWVDALCIVQDSSDDWNREAAQMPSIYKNAVVTISAAAAVDSHQGFLEDRQSIVMSQRQASRLPVFKIESENGDDDDLVNATVIGEVFITQDADLGYDIKEFNNEIINKRAWTLQEMWLAPRLVSFGSGLPQWICLEQDKTYGVDHIKPRYSWDKTHQIRRQIFTEGPSSDNNNNTEMMVYDPTSRRQYFAEWCTLSTNYFRRKLTYKTDRMAAISEIAKEFEKLLNDQYVAGLWRSSLPESLLWHHENLPQEEDPPQAKTRKRDRIRAFFASSSSASSSLSPAADPYIAPSWSPFANHGSVRMAYPYFGDFQTLCVINDLQVEPTNPLAPFLSVKEGQDWMDITAPMAQMSYEEIVTYFVIVTEGSPHIHWDWIVPDGGAANEHLGPAAKLQMEHPEINPTILIDSRTTSRFGGDLPLIQDDPQRPVPPSATTDAWPAPTNQRKRESWIPDVDFWLLEIDHSIIPAGLVLIRLDGNRFKRIGMFRMGRNQSPDWRWVNGLEISGPRRWDWDMKLKMRTCIIN